MAWHQIELTTMTSKAERAFVLHLQALGFEFETNAKDLPGSPDVVFREKQFAIFFNGCFWHSHHCQSKPKTDEWRQNLEDIRKNDKKVLMDLNSGGYQTLIVWECEWNANKSAVIELIKNRLALLPIDS